MMTLVGKFVFHNGAEYYQWGEVVEQVTPTAVLVRLELKGCPPSMSIFHLGSFLTSIAPDGAPEFDWQFFNTREELDAYMAWLFNEEKAEKAATTVAGSDNSDNVVRLK